MLDTDNSGGVSSKAALTESTICWIGSDNASATCVWLSSISFGTPDARSLPFISIVFPSKFLCYIEINTSFLIISAEDSPISRLYLLRINWIIAVSIVSPPILTDRE